MCIICLEFNRRQDFTDAEKMIEAARREQNAVSEEHLKKVEEALKKMKNGKGSAEHLDVDQ